MVKYRLSDKRIVEFDENEENNLIFQEKLKEQKLTAELITDKPGKSKGTTQSQPIETSQSQVNQTDNTELTSEDTSSELQSTTEKGSFNYYKNIFDNHANDLKENDYQTKLNNLKFKIKNINSLVYGDEDSYNQAVASSKELTQQFNDMQALYSSKIKSHNDALAAYKDSFKKYKSRKEAYFTANELDLDDINLSDYENKSPLDYKMSDDGVRMYYDKRTNTYEKEVDYEYDRSNGVRFDSDSWGQTLDTIAYAGSSIVTALPGLKGNEEEIAKTKEYMQNAIDNIPEGLYDAFLSTKAGDVDAFSANLDPSKSLIKLTDEEKKIYDDKLNLIEEKADNYIIDIFNKQQQLGVDGDGVKVKVLGKERLLKRKTTGEGITTGGSAADVIGGAFNAVVNMTQTVVPAMLTKGYSLPLQIIAPMYTSFNQAKAKSLYGDDDPDAIGKLVRNNETELIKPFALGLAATSLEYIGFKGIEKYILNKPGKAAFFGSLVYTGNREGLTEVGQLGVEKINGELASGKTIREASITAFNAMAGGEGLEMFINGFIGSTSMSVGGRALNRAIRSDDVSLKELQDKIDKISELNFNKYNSKKASIKEAIDLDIKNAENDLRNYITNKRKITEVLTEDQKQVLVDILGQKDIIKNKINNLNEQLQNGSITKKEYGYAVRGLNNQDKRLSSQILNVKTQAIEAAAAKTTETVKKQIKDIGLEGKVTEMTSEEISNMKEKGLDSKSAAQAFGFIKQQEDGSFEIILNKDKPMEGTAAHEFMHAVLFKTLKGNTETQTSLGDALEQHVTTLGGDLTNVGKRLSQYGEWIKDKDGNVTGFKKDKNFGEETITIMSESILDGSLKFDESFFTKIGDIVRRFSQNYLGKEIKFNTGRDVYNFIKDYNNSIKTGKVNKAIVKVAKEGAKGKLVGDAIVETEAVETKFSKDAKPDVDNLAVDPNTNRNYTQQEWDRSGAKRAIDMLKEENLMDGLIAAKYKVRPVPQSFVADVLGSKEFINMINRFNRGKRGKSDENKSLFGYIQGQLRFRADDTFKEAGVGQVPRGRKVEADARTTEGQEKVQLEDTSTNMETLTDNINYFQTEVQPQNTESKAEQSKLRVELGIKNIGKSEIFRKVKTALATSKAVDDKGFLKSYEKSLSSLLEPTISKILNDPAKIKKFRRGILEAIPIKTLVQMQKFLPNKIFVKDHGRQTNLNNLTKFVEKDLLPRKILDNSAESKKRRAAGVRVYERLNTTTEQFENYIDATIEGKRQKADKSGTRGNNRAKVISEVAKAIGKDATPETLTKDFVQDYLNIKDLKGKITPEKVIEKISETIDRPADLKFSLDPGKLKQSANSSANKIQENSKTKNFITSVAEKYIGSKGVQKVRYIIDMQKAGKLLREHLGGFLTEHPQYEMYFQESMSGGMGISTFGVTDVFKSVVGSTKESIKKSLIRLKYGATGKILDSNKIKKQGNKILIKEGNKFISFEKHIKNNSARLDLLENLFKDIQKYINDNPDSSPVFTAFVKDSSNNQNHFIRMMAPLISVPLNKNGSINYDKIAEEHLFPQNNVGTMLLDAAINNLSIEDTMKVIRASYAQVPLLEVHDLMVSDAKYISKMPDVFWDKIVDRIISGKLKLIDGMASIVRYTESGVDLNNYLLPEVNMTITEYFGVNVKNLSESTMEHIIPMQNELIKGILTGDVTKASATKQIQAASKINYSKSPKQTNNNYTAIEAFNKQAKIVKKINKEIQADLEKRGYKFSKSGQTPAQMIKIIQQDLEKKGYQFVDMNKKGMSTFDFDETLIIDGENFVIATDPSTNQKIEISSGNWPIKGPELAAQGYEFNFDDFVNVRGGIDGPLLQKMKNQIKKYGPENVFILTARPQSADIAINEWLKSKGVNIPFENITGLADGKGEAKAMWMLDKFAEGYNDMYFVDDALPNVKAVKDVLDQLDIKSKVVQAKIKFSLDINTEFNEMIERTSGVKAGKVVSGAEAKTLGAKSKWTFFVPPSAEDFKGLMYKMIGKGKQGDKDLAWFKKVLFDPFGKAYIDFNTYKQKMTDEYTSIKKQFPKIVKSLNKKVPGMVYTNDTAIRVYLWDKAGYTIPGLSKQEQAKLVEHVSSIADIKAFADGLSAITRIKEGYIKPNEFWTIETIATDLANTVNKVGRTQFLQDWIANKNIIFSNENMNKLESIYGSNYVDALKGVLYRMETGTNRTTGSNKQVNQFMDWINGSVGAVMFFNMRSAVLQTISMVNFLNFENNNIFSSAKAFANQPQFWKDFMFLMNSPMLKQRRAGLQIDVSASELTKAYAEGGNKAQAIIAYLLEKGFTPTKIADSFAIAMGGSTYYRNQVNFYLKQGMSNAKAEKQAMLDFQEVAEETQQSSRPDLISEQQAGPLGRLILAWQNTPMQMTRLTKKALSDLKNGRGNAKANVSKILYYGLVQNLIFGALQSAIFAVAFGGDEEEIDKRSIRIANGALDTLLRGSGIAGAAVATIKNTYMQWRLQRKKKYGRREDFRIMQELIGLSPPLGTKFRKVMSAIKTEQYNKGVGKQVGFRIENPNLHMVSNLIEAGTNLPIARILHKANNLEEAITGNHTTLQRLFLGMGWSMWSLGVKDEELEAAKDRAREQRAIDKKKITDVKKEIEIKENEIKKEKEEKEKEKKGIKTVRCSGVNSSGKRCGLTNETASKTWKCFHHAKFVDGSDRDGDGIKEYQCTGTTSSGKRCKNKGEYGKKKRCYAHQ